MTIHEIRNRNTRIWVHRWTEISEAVPDIGAYRTTLTLATPEVTVAWTFYGDLTRKQALEKAYKQLVKNPADYSGSLLARLRRILDGGPTP